MQRDFVLKKGEYVSIVIVPFKRSTKDLLFWRYEAIFYEEEEQVLLAHPVIAVNQALKFFFIVLEKEEPDFKRKFSNQTVKIIGKGFNIDALAKKSHDNILKIYYLSGRVLDEFIFSYGDNLEIKTLNAFEHELFVELFMKWSSMNQS